jgi:hypothetical protein
MRRFEQIEAAGFRHGIQLFDLRLDGAGGGVMAAVADEGSRLGCGAAGGSRGASAGQQFFGVIRRAHVGGGGDAREAQRQSVVAPAVEFGRRHEARATG